MKALALTYVVKITYAAANSRYSDSYLIAVDISDFCECHNNSIIFGKYADILKRVCILKAKRRFRKLVWGDRPILKVELIEGEWCRREGF